jgi:hypothetical protein
LNTTDKKQFFELIANVMAYYRQEATPFTLQIFWEACKNFEFDQVQKALTRHATDPDHGQYPPKVADIVRALAGTKSDRSALAWGKVYEAMKRVGQYQDLVFDDEIIHAVIQDLGGWVNVCRVNEDEISYLQHRFSESYRAYANRGEFHFQQVLIGLRSPDQDYIKRGLPIPEPVFIGNREKAEKIYLSGKQTEKVAIQNFNQLLKA